MSATYDYQPIPWLEDIRLIELHPSLDIASPLQCTLRCTTFRRCEDDMVEKYSALSYVWGHPARVSDITIDGKALGITASLDAALRHMRDPTRQRLIWADAVCINQEDVEERNGQVKQMALVYLHAHHTVIYLGESTPEVDQLFRTLQQQGYINNHLRRQRKIRQQVLQRFENGRARRYILSLPWFKRVWVLQELVFSSDPRLQCGHSCVRWSGFIQFLQESHKGEIRVPSIETRLALQMDEMLVHRLQKPLWPDLEDLEEESALDDHSTQKLLNILLSRRGLGVTDPRDMVFAHVGLIDLAFTESHLVAVAYEKEIRTVFTDCSIYIASALQDYSFLHLAEIHGPRRLSLPSWVADWTLVPPKPWVTIHDGLALRTRGEQKFEKSFSHFLKKSGAKLSTIDQCRIFFGDDNVLACAGFIAGELYGVDDGIPIFEELDSPQAEAEFQYIKENLSTVPLEDEIWHLIGIVTRTILARYEELLQPLGDTGEVLGRIQANHLRWNSCGLSKSIYEAKSSKAILLVGLQSLFQYFLDALTPQNLSSSAQFETLGVERVNYFATRLESYDDIWIGSDTWLLRSQSLLARLVWRVFQKDRPNIFYGRKLTILHVGSGSNPAVALVPLETRPGDVIGILLHHLTPLVLRPVKVVDSTIDHKVRQAFKEAKNESIPRISLDKVQHYEIVGECFVEGMMFGGPLYKDLVSNLSTVGILAFH